MDWKLVKWHKSGDIVMINDSQWSTKVVEKWGTDDPSKWMLQQSTDSYLKMKDNAALFLLNISFQNIQ